MKFKVGDRVKVVAIFNDDAKYGLKIGDVGVVTRHNGDGVCFVNFLSGIFKGKSGCNIEIDGTYLMFEDQLELAKDEQEITIRQKGRKVIAVMTEDGKYVKSAKAKCSPTDEFDFETGAKLAFRRLMGEETILVVSPNDSALPKTSSFDWDGFKQGKFAVHCDTEEKAKAFLKECSEMEIRWAFGSRKADEGHIYSPNFIYHHNDYLYRDSRAYLEEKKMPIIQYGETVREVKRPAKVGEWIKVVDAHGSFGYYSDGDIFKVLENGDRWAQGAVIVGSAEIPYIGADEYVVLENYQPEETIRPSLSIYTDKELINELSRRWEDKK